MRQSCRVLGFSRSGYYAAQRRAARPAAVDAAAVQAQAAFEELQLDRLFFIPAARSPFKPDRQPAPDAARTASFI